MPPGRSTRQRLVSNENDENTSTRITRAKAAALNMEELGTIPSSKGALQPKKSAVNAPAPSAAATRKRAALGDVSNVGKTDAADGKKAAAAKVGLVSKAAQPTGVQKNSSRPAPRAALSTKESRKTEVKRTASGSGALAAGPKRKVSSSTAAATAAATAATGAVEEEDLATDEAEPVRKKAHTLDAERRIRSVFKVEDGAKSAALLDEDNDDDDDVADVGSRAAGLSSLAEEDLDAKLASKAHLLAAVKDLDREDLDDPLMVAEYATEIFEYLRDLECRSIPNPRYMAHQDDLEWKTRGILVDWLIEVHTRFHLLPETLFLAVNIIDRFLSEKVVQLDKLQLVGITAMFIASKYEEVLSPHVENFKRITDNGFSEGEILSAERFVLNTLKYDLSYPNPMNFLRRVSKADNYDIQSRTIGKYLMEISILDHRFMAYRPSHAAAAAMFLARLILDRGDWDETLAYYAGYTEAEVEPLVELMIDYLARPVVHEAFFKKYAGKKFLKASILARQWAKKNAAFFGITDIDLSLDQIS